jgi:hypothetical protein
MMKKMVLVVSPWILLLLLPQSRAFSRPSFDNPARSSSPLDTRKKRDAHAALVRRTPSFDRHHRERDPFLMTRMFASGTDSSSSLVRDNGEGSSNLESSSDDRTKIPMEGRQGAVPLVPPGAVRRRDVFRIGATGTTAALAVAALGSEEASARLEPVNRPELLPKEPGRAVIQTERYLTSGQVRRMEELLGALERDTGYRVRVLCQRYPLTPGLAIREYWSLGGVQPAGPEAPTTQRDDDRYVVLVADDFGGRGNVLNFNVGDGVLLALPNAFWNRLRNKYGTKFYVEENGADMAIVNAVEAIATCLRSEEQYCTSVPDEAPSLRRLGM